MLFSKCLRAKSYSDMNVHFDPQGCQTLLLKESEPFLLSLGSWTNIKVSVAESHSFAHHNISIPLLLQLFILLDVWCKTDMAYSILSSIKDNACHADKVIFCSMFKHALTGNLYEENCRCSSHGF